MKRTDMIHMTKVHDRLSGRRSVVVSFAVSVLMVLSLITPGRADAQWPPFSFGMSPAYESGRITYRLTFSNKADWTMMDVTFKIPIPDGTRFLEAGAEPRTSVSFDGKEVVFFTSVVHKPLKDMFFTLEVTDPAKTVFGIQAWIAWQGQQSGDYLTAEESFDITQPELQWSKPARSRVQLNTSTIVASDTSTYTIYADSVTGQRIWDFGVNVPIPEGTTFLSAGAPSTFTTGFDGREVSFFTIELESGAEPAPLTFQVSTSEATNPLVVTHAWATWKNAGRNVGRSTPAQEDTRTGDIVVQPGTFQQVISDPLGDVPFSNYDLTSIAFQAEEAALRVTFYTATDVGPVGEPLHFILYLDTDCRADTGTLQKGRGLDSRIRYRHDTGQVEVSRWEEVQAQAGGDEETGQEIVAVTPGNWNRDRAVEVSSIVDGQTVILELPNDFLGKTGQVCWLAEARNITREFTRNPPFDRLPDDENLDLTQYNIPDVSAERVAAAPEVISVYRGQE